MNLPLDVSASDVHWQGYAGYGFTDSTCKCTQEVANSELNPELRIQRCGALLETNTVAVVPTFVMHAVAAMHPRE